MGSYLNPGTIEFQESLNSEIYIDKTGLIEKTNAVLRTKQKFVCISRPRRFGKSMAADMLAAYYERGEDAEELFANFAIGKAESFQKHLNQYDVLKINMQEFLSATQNIDEMLQMLKKYLIFDLKESYGQVRFRDEENLVQVMKDIYTATKHAFVILIDEWDCLFREYKEDKEAQRKYLDFLRAWLKDKAYVALAYMTGILPIKKYGSHSALNMFTEYSMTDPGNMAEYFGFTEKEVENLCIEYGMSIEETKAWYNGYLIDGEHMYNPNSVSQALERHKIDSYWRNTSAFDTINTFITMNYAGLKDDVMKMLTGGKVRINTNTFQNDFSIITSKDDALTALIHLGYLGYDADRKKSFIPNYEVATAFELALQTGSWSLSWVSGKDSLSWNQL